MLLKKNKANKKKIITYRYTSMSWLLVTSRTPAPDT